MAPTLTPRRWANLDRASNPENHLKRYNLYKNIASTEAVDPTTVKITLKQPFSAFINSGPSGDGDDFAGGAEKYGKEIGFHPVGTGPYKLDTWNQTDFVKVASSTGSRAAEAGLHHLASGGG
jgi:glutathione transport system substrate-binding protein